jgi:hypothetical protein
VTSSADVAALALHAEIAKLPWISVRENCTQLRTQELAESSCETMSGVDGLREVIEAWPKLSAELRAAVRAVTRTATR